MDGRAAVAPLDAAVIEEIAVEDHVQSGARPDLDEAQRLAAAPPGYFADRGEDGRDASHLVRLVVVVLDEMDQSSGVLDAEVPEDGKGRRRVQRLFGDAGVVASQVVLCAAEDEVLDRVEEEI